MIIDISCYPTKIVDLAGGTMASLLQVSASSR